MPPNNQDHEREDYPETPSPSQPSIKAPGGLTLQPLSSEADILREAATHTPPQPASRPLSSNPAEPIGSSRTSTIETSPNPDPAVIPPLPGNPKKKAPRTHKSPWPKRLLKFILFLAVVGGAVIAWAYITLSTYTVTEDDLIAEQTDATTYLRPKQWVTQDQGFGDGRGKDGKSSSMMMVRVSPAESQLVNAPPQLQELVRQQAESSLSDESIREMMSQGSNPCTSLPNIQRESNVAAAPDMKGLLSIKASCDRKDGQFKFKMHVYLGTSDGRIRIMGLGAGSSLWDTNGQVYDKILRSMKADS